MENTGAEDIPCRVDMESLEAIAVIWRNHAATLRWTCPFVLPPWLNAWWSVFGHDAKPLIAVVRQGETIIGVAPLMLRDGTARFLGGSDVCDYFDCAVAEGKESLFFKSLFAELATLGVTDLDLGHMRRDASVLRFFSECEPLNGVECMIEWEDVYSEMDLPGSWDEFLASLNGKQRHELRRKLRRLDEAGAIRFREVHDPTQLPEAVETFLKIFGMNREDKAAFMTGPMISFFRALAFALAEEGLLRLFFLDVDERPVASVFCFDYLGARYLYNNGYDEAYQGFSVGLISKVLSLQAAIDDGLRTYNFLKGGELYKTQLGGKELSLSRCHVTLRRTAA